MYSEKVIGEVLEKKWCLLIIDLKEPQSFRFSNGVSPWFLSEIEIFPSFDFMQNTCRESVRWSFRKKMKTF